MSTDKLTGDADDMIEDELEEFAMSDAVARQNFYLGYARKVQSCVGATSGLDAVAVHARDDNDEDDEDDSDDSSDRTSDTGSSSTHSELPVTQNKDRRGDGGGQRGVAREAPPSPSSLSSSSSAEEGNSMKGAKQIVSSPSGTSMDATPGLPASATIPLRRAGGVNNREDSSAPLHRLQRRQGRSDDPSDHGNKHDNGNNAYSVSSLSASMSRSLHASSDALSSRTKGSSDKGRRQQPSSSTAATEDERKAGDGGHRLAQAHRERRRHGPSGAPLQRHATSPPNAGYASLNEVRDLVDLPLSQDAPRDDEVPPSPITSPPPPPPPSTHRPVLLQELDAELLAIIKAYYEHKQIHIADGSGSGVRYSLDTAATSVPSEPTGAMSAGANRGDAVLAAALGSARAAATPSSPHPSHVGHDALSNRATHRGWSPPSRSTGNAPAVSANTGNNKANRLYDILSSSPKPRTATPPLLTPPIPPLTAEGDVDERDEGVVGDDAPDEISDHANSNTVEARSTAAVPSMPPSHGNHSRQEGGDNAMGGREGLRQRLHHGMSSSFPTDHVTLRTGAHRTSITDNVFTSGGGGGGGRGQPLDASLSGIGGSLPLSAGGIAAHPHPHQYSTTPSGNAPSPFSHFFAGASAEAMRGTMRGMPLADSSSSAHLLTSLDGEEVSASGAESGYAVAPPARRTADYVNPSPHATHPPQPPPPHQGQAQQQRLLGNHGSAVLENFPSYSATSFVRAYVSSDMNLNMEPAVIVSGLAAALNIVVVYFLRNHVLDTRDHLGLFLIGSYLIFASYYMIYYFLERFSSSFRRISSHDKKFYIIGNLLKAGIFISITPFAVYHLINVVVWDVWQGDILRNLGCIYAIPDFISMIIVKRMRWSTWIHHFLVVVFNYFSVVNDYREENVLRCVVVYAAFSSFSYCVNVLLASRFLGVSVAVARVLSFISLVVYVFCCAVNWTWQVYYLRRLILGGKDHWTVYVYMFLICLVMWDDLVLCRWLLNHARSTAFAATQQLQAIRRQQNQSATPPQLTPRARAS